MSVSCDEACDVYRVEIRKARKEHRCMACKETIRVGDRYASVHIVFEGEASTVKRCARCETIHRAIQAQWRSKGAYEMWPAERLDCGETWEDEHGDPPPPEIARLAFLTADEAQLLPLTAEKLAP